MGILFDRIIDSLFDRMIWLTIKGDTDTEINVTGAVIVAVAKRVDIYVMISATDTHL